MSKMKSISQRAALIMILGLCWSSTIAIKTGIDDKALTEHCQGLLVKINDYAADRKKLYNILSIDGGGIRGLIPGQIIDKLETTAWDYAKEKGITEKQYFKDCFIYEGKEGRIAIKDLFDMVAGTSTGSIIAAGLTYPMETSLDNKWVPKYWAEDITEVYSKQGDKIFKPKEGINPVLEVFLILIYLVIFAGIGYYFGRRWFDHPDKDKLYLNMTKLINCQKKIYKGKEPKERDMDVDMEFLKKHSKSRTMRLFGRNSDKMFDQMKKNDRLYGDSQSEYRTEDAMNEGGGQEMELVDVDETANNKVADLTTSQNKIVPDTESALRNNQQSSMSATMSKNYEKLKKDVFEFIDFGKEEHAKTAKQLLKEEKAQYEKRKPCKWFVMLMFMIIGSLCLILFTKMITFMSNSLYDRIAIENLMRDMIGRRNITDAISDEVMITAYEFNSQQPKLFTKIGAETSPNRYQVLTSNATGSSSAAPGFFEPQKIQNGYDQTELLIDGGIIANNPALLAYMFAKHLKNQDDLRILSLGTGTPFPTTYDLDGWNALDYQILSVDLMIDVDVDMADYQLEIMQKRHAEQLGRENNGFDYKNYLRAQCYTDLAMDKTSEDNINGLIAQGKELYQNNTEPITAMVKQIVEEKFGPILNIADP